MRKQILAEAKPFVVKYGWNEEILKKISKSSKYSSYEIKVIFPYRFKSILQFYLDDINLKMTDESKNIKLIHLKTHERIRELIKLRLMIIQSEKKLISKTFYYLLLPQNYKLSFQSLYKTVDQIWFLAGDNSSDFNFYTKRIILGSIYSSVIMHFINNNNIDDTIKLLNKHLKQVSKIPKIKNKFKHTFNFIPVISKLAKNINFFKQ